MSELPDQNSPEFEQIYERLRALAHRERSRMAPSATLNTTALVHEVYLDILAAKQNTMAPRDFFGYAAKAMRDLRSIARPPLASQTWWWGQAGGARFSGAELGSSGCSRQDELNDALRNLATLDPRAAEVVEIHCFRGPRAQQNRRVDECVGAHDQSRLAHRTGVVVAKSLGTLSTQSFFDS